MQILIFGLCIVICILIILKFLNKNNIKKLEFNEDVEFYIKNISNFSKKNSNIYGLWIGKNLKKLHHMCLKSFLKNDYNVYLFTYEKVSNVPIGVIQKDANQIIKKDFIYKYSDSYASFSDLFRYKLLYMYGGIWVDLDLFCRKPFHNLNKIIFSCEQLDNKECSIYNTNPIKINKNNVLMFELYSNAFKIFITKYVYINFFVNKKANRMKIEKFINDNDDFNIFSKHEKMDKKYITFDEFCFLYNLNPEHKHGQKTWGEIGPTLITEKIKSLQYDKYMYEPIYFSPIHYQNISQFQEQKFGKFFEDSNIFIFNLYNTMWKYQNRDFEKFEKGSIIDKMYKFLRPTIQVVLPTIGRKSIFKMLECLKNEMEKEDKLLIVFDSEDVDNVFKKVENFCYRNFKCHVTILFEKKKLGFGGHPIRNKYNNFETDFVFHVDDDDILTRNCFHVIKNICVSKHFIYIFLMTYKNTILPSQHDKIKIGDIGTPNGIIPAHINKKMKWGLFRGGDGHAYQEICKENPIIYINKIIYEIKHF